MQSCKRTFDTELLMSCRAAIRRAVVDAYSCSTDVVADGVELTEIRILHAEVGTVGRHLAGLLLQVCKLLAVVFHLEQHEGWVPRGHAMGLHLLPVCSEARDPALQLSSLFQQSAFHAVYVLF